MMWESTVGVPMREIFIAAALQALVTKENTFDEEDRSYVIDLAIKIGKETEKKIIKENV